MTVTAILYNSGLSIIGETASINNMYIVSVHRCAGKKLHHELILNQQAQDSHLVERFLAECLCHSNLRHPNIVQLIGVHIPDSDLLLPTIIMEYLPMTLTKCLDKYPSLPPYMESSILHDVAVGLEYLHSQTPPIMHRDLTPNNVLLTNNMEAKISDLGQAKIFDISPTTRQTTVPGNVCYMPPEALVSKPSYSTKLDIFSFGVLILHVALHVWPFPNDNIDTQTHQVKVTNEVERRKVYFEKMDSTSLLTKLAAHCLQNDPTKRPNATELVQSIEESSPTRPFANTLQMQLELDAQSRKCQALQQHIQALNAQMKTVHDDLKQSSDHDTSSICTKLQAISLSGEAALTGENGSNLIVGYCSPSGRRKSDIKLSTMQTSGSKVAPDNTMEVIVRAPLNIHFTGTLVRSIEGIATPWGLACNREGHLFVVSGGWKGVLLYDSNGEKLGDYVPSLSRLNRTTAGYCYFPRGVATGSDDTFVLVDTWCHRVQKFELSPDLKEEKLLKHAGACGYEEKEFNYPMGIQVHKENGDVYVCDKENHRIQILDSELQFKGSFGERGDGSSNFLYPWDIDFDSQGNIYVVDCGHYVIKVFSQDWVYLGEMGGPGHGRGTFQEVTSICIDKHDYIYATDKRWNCVQVFDPQREFVMQFQLPFFREKSSEPVGITSDCNGCVYVSCKASGCVHVYK